MRKHIVMGMALLLSGSLAFAADMGFNDYDTDADGSISKDEFRGSVAERDIFSAWDRNADARIDENEWGDADRYDDEFFSTWDIDNDGFLNDDEFYDGTFGHYDEDESGHWDGNEWDDAGDEGFWDV